METEKCEIMHEKTQQQIQHNLEAVREEIQRACSRAGRNSDQIRLVAVTKTFPVETPQCLIDLGVEDIGENKVQEITEKVPQLSGDFTMHMIGHLQSNKVAKVVPLVSWIHSLDRIKLIDKVARYADACEKTVNVLIQVNTTGELAKSGCDPRECAELCEYTAGKQPLHLRGLMTMGPLLGGEKKARESFVLLRNLAEQCAPWCREMELSMGMSGDFQWAIEEGATMVRIGSRIVGERSY
jgi:hypothetical protein